MNPLAFRQLIFDHYVASGRTFPWRQTSDPYAIVVSELMLQQTQTDRVIPKYEAFLSALPDWQALATVSNADLLILWQGLGYNRRALNLKKMAEAVMREYGGLLPDDYEKLIALPGIGPYTAGAVLAFAFNSAVPLIETNIRRVYIHHFFADREGVTDKELMQLIEQTMDRENAREWYWALMDYGAALAKRVPNPNRKSKHYAKQGPLAGSNREVRGAIIRALSYKDALSRAELVRETCLADDRMNKPLDQLVSEGFIVADGEHYKLS
jgi:A/G-specific adenine glycosylase